MGTSLARSIRLLALLAILVSCQRNQPGQQPPGETIAELQIVSSVLESGETIPGPFTCDGDDVSPPLSWSEPPEATQSLALICEDVDAPAGTWIHWVLFNIPAGVRSLPEGIPADETVAGLGVHGTNDWRRLGYGGPCPPEGSEHRYYFRLYALDTMLDLAAGANSQDVEREMKGHTLAEGQLLGRYAK